jgi:hypothetical protein
LLFREGEGERKERREAVSREGRKEGRKEKRRIWKGGRNRKGGGKMQKRKEEEGRKEGRKVVRKEGRKEPFCSLPF